MIRIGIVGYGYWGKNLVRNFNSLDTCDLVYVCESNAANAAKCKANYPNITVVSEYKSILNDHSIDAIVIATPVDTHFPLTKLALEADKHVLVEKPLTSSYEEAKELVGLADSKEKVLMVDHTFLYTGAVKYMKSLIETGEIGDIQYLDSIRINLGLFQHDVNVLWDLAPHDISICNYLLKQKPVSVQAIGASHIDNDIENIAYLTLRYPNNVIAHFNCSWVSPVKLRQMLIGGTKKMIVFNDMEPTEKIKIYDTGYEVKSHDELNQIKVDYRIGDIHVPKVPMTEALALMAADFINSINTGEKPDSDAELGLGVVEILDTAQSSIKQNETEIALG